MNFGSKLLHIALTTMHLHTEVSKQIIIFKTSLTTYRRFLSKHVFMYNLLHRWVGFTGGQFSTNFQAFKPILTGKKQLFRKDK